MEWRWWHWSSVAAVVQVMDGLHGCNSPVINSGKSVTREGSKGNGVWLLRLFAHRLHGCLQRRLGVGLVYEGRWLAVFGFLQLERRGERMGEEEGCHLVSPAMVVCLSSVDPASFIAVVEAGALMSMMCITSYCADNAFHIINLMRETKRLLPSVTLSVTVLHTLSLPDQVKLDEQLELEGVDIIQMEGEKCSTPSKAGVLGLIKKAVNIPVMCSSGLSVVTTPMAIIAGAASVALAHPSTRSTIRLEASSKCSSFITLSSKSEIDPNVINWKGVSKDVKDDYFGEFKALKIGRDPTPSELHLHVHTHNHDGKSLVGERSRLLHLREQQKKKRLFGLGSEADSYFGKKLCAYNASSSSVSPSVSLPTTNLEEFVKQLIPALTTHFLSLVIEHVGGIRVQQGVVLDPPPNNDDDDNVDS
ncbi:stigma-specific Stig1 family protein [Capsicum annuum]|nr:stigma-specific Stig1 family protein [Capsicum annuum]